MDFGKKINELQNNIDLSFMKDFLYLIKRKDCCIYYKKLEEYGILKFDSSKDFKLLLEKN